MPDFEASITVDATPADLYALISDLPRMGEWSTECTRVTWLRSTTYAVPGARFIGHNRAGAIRWFPQGVVVDADPGRRFSFRIHFGPIQVASWSYDLTATPTGCQVTESWTDHRPAALHRPLALIFGNRRDRNTAGIHHTLKSLKTAAESPPPTSPAVVSTRPGILTADAAETEVAVPGLQGSVRLVVGGAVEWGRRQASVPLLGLVLTRASC
ncbi:SRPBCC family protein [Kribbella monticola]|uniref:SRPBCC family protein n=1 Tax=Kribbella monticola TaxID=2185285 RepID=UPI0013005B94|nr:SRPBCC family protein [Kribbella monticola]